MICFVILNDIERIIKIKRTRHIRLIEATINTNNLKISLTRDSFVVLMVSRSSLLSEKNAIS